MQHFNIQIAAQMSGLSTHTIRAWEKRYHALKPERSPSGRRQYSDQDLERLTLLSQLTTMGNSISQIARLPNKELESILEKVRSSKNVFTKSAKKATNSTAHDISATEVLTNLKLGLSVSKMDIISHELEKAQKNLSPGVFAKEILTPFLEEVSARRAGGLMTVDQEKSLLAITKFHVSNSIYHYSSFKVDQGRVALATMEGDLNPLPIMLATLLCAENNNNFFYLSTNLSSNSIAEAVKAIQAKKLILGVSENMSSTDIDKFLDNLTGFLDTQLEIWLLGKGIKSMNFFPYGFQVRVMESMQELEQALK